MIAEIFAGAAILAAGGAAWAWRSALGAKDRALAELEARRVTASADATTIRKLADDLRTARSESTAALASLTRARKELEIANQRGRDNAQRLREAYGLLSKAGIPGSGDHVRRLMREASGTVDVPDERRDTDADPEA